MLSILKGSLCGLQARQHGDFEQASLKRSGLHLSSYICDIISMRLEVLEHRSIVPYDASMRLLCCWKRICGSDSKGVNVDSARTSHGSLTLTTAPAEHRDFFLC